MGSTYIKFEKRDYGRDTLLNILNSSQKYKDAQGLEKVLLVGEYEEKYCRSCSKVPSLSAN